MRDSTVVANEIIARILKADLTDGQKLQALGGALLGLADQWEDAGDARRRSRVRAYLREAGISGETVAGQPPIIHGMDSNAHMRRFVPHDVRENVAFIGSFAHDVHTDVA